VSAFARAAPARTGDISVRTSALTSCPRADGVKGAMGHSACNWQDDARSKDMDRASMYFEEEEDGGVCGDAPKSMMQDLPGASGK